MATKYVCARCGVPVGVWFYGWKHQNGWRGKPSCGQKPVPIERENYRLHPTPHEGAQRGEGDRD